MLRSTAPIVSARSARRTFGIGDVSSSDRPVGWRSFVSLSPVSSRWSLRTTRRTSSRLMRTRMYAMTMISRTRSGTARSSPISAAVWLPVMS